MLITAVRAPDGGYQHPKHVELSTKIYYTKYIRILLDNY